MIIFFGDWAKGERDLLESRLGEAIPKLEGILSKLHFAAGSGDALDLRIHLSCFEEVEASVSDDLELLEPFYQQFPEEYGWRDAEDAELVEAARKAFGGAV